MLDAVKTARNMGLHYQNTRASSDNTKPPLGRVVAVVFVFLVLLAWHGTAAATLIDFEDLTAANGAFIPQGYRGFSWLGGGHTNGESSWVNSAFDELCDPTPACEAGTAHTGRNYAWSNGGVHLELSDGLFDIQSLWVSFRADPRGFPDFSLFFDGFLDGIKVYTATLLLPNDNAYRKAELNFTGIDTLILRGETNHNVLVDDIVFSKRPVPVPGTLFLTLAGVLVVGWSKRSSR